MAKGLYDEYYTNGKIELARTGKNVSLKNHFTKDEIKQRNHEIASHYEESVSDISKLVAGIREKIKRCDPLLLLVTANDLSMVQMVNVLSDVQLENSNVGSLRLVEYIQSVLVSTKLDNNKYDKETQDKIIMEILSDIEELYTKCQYFYFIWAAREFERGVFSDKEIEYIVEAQLFSNVRGNRYQFQQLNDLATLILPHNSIMEEIYGISAKNFIEGLKKLEYALSSAKLDAFKNLTDEFKKFQSKAINKSQEELEDLFDEVREYTDSKSVMAKCFGYDLHDVKKVTNWGDKLVQSFSWKIGENADFFERSEYPGWPIQDLPVQKRPFININGVCYCFDYYNLFDNVYRILQKNIRLYNDKYATKWSNIQQGASEELVADKFKKLMPNANVYVGNYYPEANSLKKMDENDIMVICDDIIIIAEVKAGSFTYTPAITDFEAHKNSFNSLIGKADYQCIRTYEYIEKCDLVKFYTKDKKEKFEFERKKIRKIYSLCVTVDNFNVFEAKIEKTNFFNIANGTIAINIDDLDAYTFYFESELCFLHYLKHRQAATRLRTLMLTDEFDHLGMYIDKNAYEDFVYDNRDCTSFVAIGFREDIDKYFAGKHNPALHIDKPEQPIPEYINEILKYLESNNVPGRVKFAEFLLDLSYNTRVDFDEAVKNRIHREQELGRVTPVWFEGDFAYCAIVNIPNIQLLDKTFCKKYTYANMLERKYDNCWFIWLELNNAGKIVNIFAEELEYKNHSIDGFSDRELRELVDFVKKQRRKSGITMPSPRRKKIYPNDICPCGSGMKYKKCCGRTK